MKIGQPKNYEFQIDLPHPLAEVFDWHRRPGAFSRLVPPWQPTKIGAEAANLADGTAILLLPGGRKWVAQHLGDEFEDQHRFVDELVSRPFLVPVPWRHRHDFDSHLGGTSLVDRVTTTLPARLVKPIFSYRHRQLSDDLSAHLLTAHEPRLTVAVTGSSGLVGRALCAFLTTGGHTVIRLVRHAPTDPLERSWDPSSPTVELLRGVDAVVHLAGQPIAGRFNAEHKERIRNSRVEPTRLLAQAADVAGVRSFVSASAIGYYGADRGDDQLTENSEPGSDFLAQVVQDWEQAALSSTSSNMRVVAVRTGIVQSPRGGALRLQRPLFSAGLGGPMGSGLQWQSWIAVDDLVDVYHRCLVDDEICGPINAVAPNPVRQREFASALAAALKRPAVLPTPRFGPRLILGAEGAREIAFANQRVIPQKLLDRNHRFRFTEVESALRHLFGNLEGESDSEI
ncbi:MAG TPA: TIGR01777 family oxidoreductase [Aeromicrobium sp.]|nr:TIGR01777 family oxidoreductase [Aeromicrobium sp.]